MKLFFKIILFQSFFFCLNSFAKVEALEEQESEAFSSGIQIEDLGFIKRDTPYYTYSVFDNLDIIYSENFKNFLPVLTDYTKKIDSQLSKVFQKKPYFKNNSIIFKSSRSQISNAYAQVKPLSVISINPSVGVRFLDQWSVSNWSYDVLLHEMTHIYQLSQNLEWDRNLWRFLGLISYRNNMLPTFILEGDAILNESIYGFGGRLFSGWARAFVFSQIKQGFSLKRLLRSYDDSFSGIEQYLHGGYFFAYLHSQYGIKKTHHFFSESGKFIPWDFYGLNSSLKRTFGKGLELLFKEYKDHYLPIAKEQKSSTEKAFLKSQVSLPINSDENQIYFLISDLKSIPKLIVVDKKTKHVKKQNIDLRLGKVFYRDNKYYSASSERTSSTSIEYTLIGEGFKPVKKYNSQNVMDFYKSKAISLDARQNHTQNSLLVDNVFYDTTHSSAIANHKGQIYYFKQDKDRRVLYRDKQALFSFKSYYAYPVEADEGGLYFIGATSYGSSLFVYKEKRGVFRLSSSDTISQARKIKGNEFLVSEITPTHHEYKIIQTKEFSEEPFFYTYSFEKQNPLQQKDENLIETQKNLKNASQNKINSQIIKNVSQNKINSHKPYDSLSNLSLYHMVFSYSVDFEDLSSYHFSSDFLFLDPLKFNKLLFHSSIGKYERLFQLSYAYRKYRPFFSFSFIYDESYLKEKESKYEIKTLKELGFLEIEDIYNLYPNNILRKKIYIPYRDRLFNFSLDYPFLIKPDWNLFLDGKFTIGQKQFSSNVWKNYINHSISLSYSFKKKYNYAYSFSKRRYVQLSYSMLHLSPNLKNHNSYLTGSMKAYLMEEIGKEWFFTLSALGKRKIWNKKPRKLIFQADTEGSFFNYSSLKQSAQNLYSFNFQILKVLNHSHYFLKVPFAVRRWAPLAGFSFLSFQEENKKYQFLLAPFLGVESELNLLSEKAIFKAGFSVAYVFDLFNITNQATFQLSTWLKTNF